METRSQPESWAAARIEKRRQLGSTTLVLAALAIVCSFALGYFSYVASRDTALENLRLSRLRLVRTLAAQYQVTIIDNQEPPSEALKDLKRAWDTTERRYTGSYLCVVQNDARLVLNTSRPCDGGGYVGDVRLEDADGPSPATVSDLIRKRADWVGTTIGPDGQRRLSAYAYVDKFGGLLAVHVPWWEVNQEIQAMAMPWALSLGAMTLLLLVLAGAVLQRQHRYSTSALEESQRALSTLMGNLPGMVYRCRNDRQWTMEFVSDGSLALTGYRPEELTRNSKIAYAELIHPDDREMVWSEVQLALGERRSFQFSYRIRTFTGEDKHVWEQGQGVFDGKGQLVALEGYLTDVTERRHLEMQLQQAQKMEAVGRLAGGVAHDFNNLLMVVGGHCELLISRLEAESPLRRHAEEIRRTAERATVLTRQLLAFSRKQVLEPHVLNLNEVVQGATAMLERVLGEDVDLQVKLAPQAGQVRADPHQIEQVIMNLAVNARDAMPGGGTLTLETGNVDLDEAYARSHESAKPGPHVMLAVSDTGEGMTKEVQARIFEPFFTTKEKGKGTGLGLAMVYGIIKQSEGNIWLYSEPGHGTTFKVYLPRVDQPVAAAKPPVPTKVTSRGDGRPTGQTVLLVEDEEALRGLVHQFLETMGYRVLETGNVEEALRLAREHAGEIALMITDVVMPGMSGRALAEKVAPLRPTMKILFVSGYPNDAVMQKGILEPGTMFLQKPFTIENLREKLQEVFAS